MIELKGVEKSYGTARVIRGISLHVARGEFVAVMGSSGSGKSTLLNLIGGMDRPDAGTLIAGGRDLSSLSDAELTAYRRRDVGFIFQFFNLLPDITILDNVRMPLLLNGITGREPALDGLRRVGMADREEAYPHELSGGQQQRVAIARALVHQPAIILADEPTGSLDSENSLIIMEFLEELASAADRTVILVTHEYSIARRAQRVLTLKDGLIG
jgi:putative ABC transport system ATP-binding protein